MITFVSYCSTVIFCKDPNEKHHPGELGFLIEYQFQERIALPPNQPMRASWYVSLQKVRSEGKET